MRKWILSLAVILIFVLLSVKEIKEAATQEIKEVVVTDTKIITLPKVKYLTSAKVFTNNEPTKFTVTGYTAGPESTGKSPGHPEYGVTYTGTHVRMPTAAEPGACAVDPNVIPFGTVFFVEGYGICRAEDKGSAVKGYHIDVYVETVEQAYKWIGNGKRNVWILSDWSD